jgi:FixJ family two-component response regulator
MKEQKPTVFVLHDDGTVAKELHALMASVQLPVETYGDIAGLQANLDASRMGCLILDVRMREMSGIELCRRLRAQGIALPVIFVTAHGDVPTAVVAMQEGAFDFLQRPFSEQYLLDRVHAAMEKDRRDRSRMAERRAAAVRFEALSAKERQVLDLILSGRTSKAMAGELGIGLKTVDFHRANIMRKVGVETVGELVCLLFKGGYGGMPQDKAVASEERRPKVDWRDVQDPFDYLPVRRRCGLQRLECNATDTMAGEICLPPRFRDLAGTTLQAAAGVESM